MGTGKLNAGCNTDGLASHPRKVEILLFTSCYRNLDKLQPDGPFGSHAELMLMTLPVALT